MRRLIKAITVHSNFDSKSYRQEEIYLLSPSFEMGSSNGSPFDINGLRENIHTDETSATG